MSRDTVNDVLNSGTSHVLVITAECHLIFDDSLPADTGHLRVDIRGSGQAAVECRHALGESLTPAIAGRPEEQRAGGSSADADRDPSARQGDDREL